MASKLVATIRQLIKNPETSESEKHQCRKVLAVLGESEDDAPQALRATAQSGHAADLDRAMGLSRGPTAAHWNDRDPSKFSLPAMTPDQARAQLEKNGGFQ